MRVAVISDIHSNHEALKAVLSDIGTYDALVCLGDLVGYGAQPNEVISEVKSLKPDAIVMGNHDHAVSTGDTSGFVDHAIRAIEWTRREISSENMRYISSLQARAEFTAADVTIVLVHGSPRDPLNEYIYSTMPQFILRSLLDESHGTVLLLGHTHVPFNLEFDAKIMANPGSVGQPRDGDPRASYGILEISARTSFEVHRTAYDIDAAASKIAKKALPRLLADRLHVGI